MRVATFGGASAFPILVAERIGAFEAAGLTVATSVTTDSGAMRAGLEDGNLDVVHASPDNVIAWSDGVADTPGFDVVVWLAGLNGPISLVVRRVRTLAALRGCRLGVDSPHSGFAPILRRVLATAGLGPDDVELVALGATRHRYAALVDDSTIDACMLTLPWTILAAERGCVAVADHTDAIRGLLTSAGASRRSWLETHREEAAAYRVALDAAYAWLRDPGSREAATSWLAADLSLAPDIAAATFGALLDQVTGWPVDSRLRAGALDAVARIRTDGGTPPRHQPDQYLVLG